MISETFGSGAQCSPSQDSTFQVSASEASKVQVSSLLRIERRVAPRPASFRGTTVPRAGYAPMVQALLLGKTAKVVGFHAESINSVRTSVADVEAISVQATTGTPRKGSALSGVRAWRPPV